jgi:hypothetical protein
MPFKSDAQRRLMYAAASKKGGAGGVSQKAAKKFIAHSKADQRGRKYKWKEHRERTR